MEKVDLTKVKKQYECLNEDGAVKDIYLDVSHNLSAFEAVVDSLK